MKYLVALLLLAGLPLAARAAIEPATPDEIRTVTAQVHRIFEAKCADCHGSHRPKPKGKFGYVLDLERVGKNPDYIMPGDVKKSELYRMVKEQEMPGEDADVPPLTPEELAVVARWVAIGAPGEPVPPGGTVATNAVQNPPESAPAHAPFFTRLLNWMGKFHPASTHFPVALLLSAVVAEFFAWWFRRSEWTLVVRFLVVLGALSAIPTAALGWMVSFPTVKGSQLAMVYNIHRILGTAAAIWGVVCAILICMAECKEGSSERLRFRGALLSGAVIIVVTGLLGGMLTFGVDHYNF